MNSIHDLRDYYKRQEAEAVRLMLALPDGIEKQSAEDAVEEFRLRFMHYTALCDEATG